MGFNSVLLILNDHISHIENAPASFWTDAWDALARLRAHETERFGDGVAISCQHADSTVVIVAVGSDDGGDAADCDRVTEVM